MNRIMILALAGASLWTLPVSAQDVPDPGAATAPTPGDAVTRETLTRLPAVESATSDPQGGAATSAISLLGSSDDTSVAVTVSSEPKRLREGGYGYGSLAFKAPIKEGDTEGSFLSGQGFANKFSATAAYTFLFIDTSARPETIGRIQVVIERIKQKCRRDLRAEGSQEEVALLDGPPSTALFKLLDEKCHWSTAVGNYPEEYKKKYFTQADQDEIDAIYYELLGGRPLTILTLSGSIGYKKFDYLDATTFAEDARKTVPFGFSATLGRQANRTAPSLAIGYEYKRDFKAADERVLCPAGTGGTTPVECKDEIFDAPKHDDSQTVFALARFRNLFGIGSNRLAKGAKPPKSGPVLEIKGGYDFEDKIFGASVPLYFLLDKDGEVKGGVRVDWEEKGSDPDKDQLRFSVFVTKSFGFLDL